MNVERLREFTHVLDLFLEEDVFAGRTPAPELRHALLKVGQELYCWDYIKPEEPTARDELSQARYQDELDAWRRRNDAADEWWKLLLRAYNNFASFFPQLCYNQEGSAMLPLRDILPNEAWGGLAVAFTMFKGDVFYELRRTLKYNWNQKREDKSDDEIDIIRDTPFERLLDVKIPFRIPDRAYREHGAIFAPSGHGKTQLLQSMIVDFLKRPPPAGGPPGMFILDSRGDMLKKIERLKIVPRERLVVLDPEDENPPALNFFQIGSVQDVQVDERFHYLFTAIDADLTSKQSTAVTYLVRLMRHIPGATIETLLEIMEETPPSKYQRYIDALDPLAQSFFRNQFFNRAAMGQTRQQVARRLYTILSNATFVKMFAAPENRFDALKALREKSIVLINTSHRHLGTEASAVFGRFMIASILAAAFQRGQTADLSLLVIDEASEYFDQKTERILSQARQYGLGLLFATQFLEQMPPQVKAAVNGNTAIKMAGPVAYNDAMMLSREMYTTGDFIRSMRATGGRAEFATYVRGETAQAVRLSTPYFVMEDEATIDEALFRDFRRNNRERYGATPGRISPHAEHAATLLHRREHAAPVSPAEPEVFEDKY